MEHQTLWTPEMGPASQSEEQMVRRCDTEQVLAYELCDDQGHALGRVVLPRDETIVGPQAATVLLRREIPPVHPRFGTGGGAPARAA